MRKRISGLLFKLNSIRMLIKSETFVLIAMNEINSKKLNQLSEKDVGSFKLDYDIKYFQLSEQGFKNLDKIYLFETNRHLSDKIAPEGLVCQN